MTEHTSMTQAVSLQKTGLIAIVGRPNVGKSTLLNALIGSKISITSDKAQTTRHRITGILTKENTQYVFVDTPGFQPKHAANSSGALNRVMNRNIVQTLTGVDVIVWVIEANRFKPEDEAMLAVLPKHIPVMLLINKTEGLSHESLLPFLLQIKDKFNFAEIMPVSALKKLRLDDLLSLISKHLPEAPFMFSEDDLTDRNEKFLAAEFVREKLFRLMGDEVPYGATVVIEKFEQSAKVRKIFAAILVEREAHKAMVIGHGGQRIKRIGSEARQDLENLFGGNVYLELFVKIRSGWAQTEASLNALGYE